MVLNVYRNLTFPSKDITELLIHLNNNLNVFNISKYDWYMMLKDLFYVLLYVKMKVR